MFTTFLPGMIQTLGDCLNRGDEASARHGFDVFETLLIVEAPLLGPHTRELVQGFIMWGTNKEYAQELRIMALNSLGWVVK